MRTEEQGPEVGEAMVQLCSVRAGAGLYGVDTRSVREVLGSAAPQRVPLAPEYIAGVLAYRGQVLEAVSLRALLGMEPQAGEHRVLVLEDDERGERFGLVVDDVGGMVTMAESALEENPATLEGPGAAIFSGIYRMDSGLMARLDPARLRPMEPARNGAFDGRMQAARRETR